MTVEPVVPIAALEHHLYCPRQCALIHVDGLWVDNEHTVRGTAGHERADNGGDRIERGEQALRAVPLWSESLGLSGRADVVLRTVDGALAPVEYKIGVQHGLAAHVQLCAQAMCLEEMTGQAVASGFVWLSKPRRRVRVDFTAALREKTVTTISEVRSAMSAGRLPRPVNDARCAKCQFLDHCQPELSSDPNRVSRYLREVIICAS